MKMIEMLMEYLVTNRAPKTPPKAIAEIFDRLTWVLDSKGVLELGRMRDSWLVGNDEFRVSVALLLEVSFPVSSKEDLIKLRESISLRFPNLGGVCDSLLQEWVRQFENSSNHS